MSERKQTIQMLLIIITHISYYITFSLSCPLGSSLQRWPEPISCLHVTLSSAASSLTTTDVTSSHNATRLATTCMPFLSSSLPLFYHTCHFFTSTLCCSGLLPPTTRNLPPATSLLYSYCSTGVTA